MKFRALIGFLALGSVAAVACSSTEVRTITVGRDGGQTSEESGVDPEADGGPDPFGDGGSFSDARPVPRLTAPTAFKRTLDCTTGACNAGTCTINRTANCNLTSPCRGKDSGIKITDPGDFPLKIKTPKVTASDPGCGQLCGPGDGTVYAVSVQVKTPTSNQPIAIRVPAPWRVSVGDDRYGPIYCRTGGDPVPAFKDKDCVAYYGSGNGTFALVTSDPNAPSVDVTVELLGVGDWPTQFDGQCPY
jgi:hypothetical protein